jgi:hypothetical protein
VQAISAQTLYRVYAHSPQHILNFKTPATKKVSQSPSTDVRVNSLGQGKVSGANSPRTLSSVALLAKSATQSDECGCSDVDGIGAKSNGFCYIATISDSSRNNN